ncbi:hypothetical protein ES706_02403 [subsurface metagenome]
MHIFIEIGSREARSMNVYECRYCGKRKLPDGAGCECGASYGSLRVVSVETDEWMKLARGEEGEVRR